MHSRVGTGEGGFWLLYSPSGTNPFSLTASNFHVKFSTSPLCFRMGKGIGGTFLMRMRLALELLSWSGRSEFCCAFCGALFGGLFAVCVRVARPVGCGGKQPFCTIL
eukprot:RCo051643